MTQKYQVKVSMKQAAIVETGIVLKQGDFGMQLEIEVLDFDATGTTPQIVFRKAMGAVESTTITVSSNKYTYTFKGTELDTPGKVFCDLKLKNSTTQRISTASFMFKVVADTLDGLAEESSSYSDTIADIAEELANSVDAEIKQSLGEIYIHTEYTNDQGTGSKDIPFPGKAGQTLRIITDETAVNICTRATETGANIQTQYVPGNRTFDLAITTDFEWLHLYYTANAVTNFYIVETVLTEATDDIAEMKGEISDLQSEDIELQSGINNHESIIAGNLMGIDVQENLYPGAADWSGEWINSDPAHVSVSDTLYNGYRTVYSSQSWRRYTKNIPVEAGKTYTFEGWIKHATAGAVIAYITADGVTTDAATVSPTYKQVNEVSANVWTKISVTFACSAAGNVSPFILSSTSAFYISKYNLAEGDNVFSLQEALSDTVTSDDLSTAIGGVQNKITKHSDIISSNMMGIDVQENLYPGAADWSGEWTNSDPVHMELSNVLFEGYPTVYSSKSWRRFYKEIPIEAGKTYTFEGWIKHATAGSAFVYITYENTTNPATISPNSKQYNLVPANEWAKLTLTFTCSASGNISPFILSSTGAFYISKYNLVASNKAFSLSEELNNKALKQEVSGVGDYTKYTFLLDYAGVGEYWNNEIVKSITSGTKVKMVFDSYSGSKLLSVRIDGKKNDNTYTVDLCHIISPIHGGTAEFIANENYVALRVQYARSEAENDINSTILIATSQELGITNDLLKMHSQEVFKVEKDGTGDFTSFAEAINTACQHMDSIVYVGAGEYDLLDELGSDYIKQAGVNERKGLVLKNRVHVICSSQTVLKMHNDISLYDTEQQYLNAKEYLSPINTGEYGCILENAVIDDDSVRYSIHDDQGWNGPTPYTNKFINCTLIHKNGMYGDCIGGGLGENCEIEIRGCYLEGDASVERLAYYHGNNHTGIEDAKGNIIVCDNYFANMGSFWLTKYGDSTEMTTALVSNNSFGSEPQVTAGSGAQNNMRMIAWNNEIRE